MRFKLEISCDNAAFDSCACDEIARILTELADRMDWGAEPEMNIRDSNGNICGSARFISELDDED